MKAFLCLKAKTKKTLILIYIFQTHFFLLQLLQIHFIKLNNIYISNSYKNIFCNKETCFCYILLHPCYTLTR